MAEMGQSRGVDTPPAVAACPLRAESGQVGRQLAKSALCHKPTYAPQQSLCLFDHPVGAAEHRRRNLETKRSSGLEIDDQLKFGRLLDG
jgi:hypothetical protein